MTDIIERLRLVDITFWWKPLEGGDDTELDVPAYELGALSHEAADEIERLRAERNELKKTAFMKDLIGKANWKQVCKENEDMRKALWKARQICHKALGEKE
jgi:hypothetical protein